MALHGLGQRGGGGGAVNVGFMGNPVVGGQSFAPGSLCPQTWLYLPAGTREGQMVFEPGGKRRHRKEGAIKPGPALLIWRRLPIDEQSPKCA